MDSFFTLKITSSDEFDVPSLSAQDVTGAQRARTVDEVSVEASVKVQS